ncbi:copper resistance protein CopC [Rhodobacterales bacterium HKCCE3408]|nr:copper resistance protein CopC [Rhodobacterales bacterium HKCCE3408]
MTSRVFLGAAAALLLSASTALAHSDQIGSEPEAGSVVTEALATIALQFDEPVRVTRALLTGPDGTELDLSGPMDESDHWEVDAPELVTGDWLLDWRGLSADGHPVRGTVPFEIGY